MPKDDDDVYPSSPSSTESEKSPFKSPLKKVHLESDKTKTHFKDIQDFIVQPVDIISKTIDQPSVSSVCNRLKNQES